MKELSKDFFVNLEKFEKKAKEATAACIFAVNPLFDGSILGVTRKSNFADIGFPGGKIDKNSGENALDAAIRECYEETGLLVEKSSLIPLHCKLARTNVCATYFAPHIIGGALLPETKEGMPLWCNLQMFIKDSCTYKHYNLDVIKKFEMLKSKSCR